MAETLAFDFVAPDRRLASGEVEMVTMPGSEGDFAVLIGHQPLVASLRPGVVEITREGGETERIYIRGGFAEVTNERCLLLAEEAVPVNELDRAALEQRIQDNEEDLADAETDEERHRAETALSVLRDMLQAVS